MDKTQDEKYLPAAKAAEYIDMPYRALLLSRYVHTLKGIKAPKHYNRGRFVFYKEKDLDSWIEMSIKTLPSSYLKIWPLDNPSASIIYRGDKNG